MKIEQALRSKRLQLQKEMEEGWAECSVWRSRTCEQTAECHVCKKFTRVCVCVCVWRLGNFNVFVVVFMC
jgi:hypothetical protein